MNRSVIVVREVRRNVARNHGAAFSVVVASALGAGLVGVVAVWSDLVGRARALTAGSFAVLGIATQVDVRIPLFAGAVLAAEVIALSTTTLAMRRRRLSEIQFFERTLGAPAPYTRPRRWPKGSPRASPAAWSVSSW